MLRITTEECKNPTELKLEGKLAGVWVDELEQTWHAFARGEFERRYPRGPLRRDLH